MITDDELREMDDRQSFYINEEASFIVRFIKKRPKLYRLVVDDVPRLIAEVRRLNKENEKQFAVLLRLNNITEGACARDDFDEWVESEAHGEMHDVLIAFFEEMEKNA